MIRCIPQGPVLSMASRAPAEVVPRYPQENFYDSFGMDGQRDSLPCAFAHACGASCGAAVATADHNEKTAQWADGRGLRGSFGSDVRRVCELSHRLSPGAGGPDRICSPVRAPDVRRHTECAQRRAGPGDRRRRRDQQRRHPLRLHRIHRDGARLGSGSGALDRGRSHEDAGFLSEESRQPAQCRGGGSARQRAESSLRALLCHRPAWEGVRHLSQCA